MQQVGTFLLPDPEDFQRHADAIGDDALFLFATALAVGGETAVALLAAVRREVRRAVDRAVADAWVAAHEAMAEAEAAA